MTARTLPPAARRSAIARSSSSGSIVHVARRSRRRTASRPCSAIAFALAANVSVEQTTSSPGADPEHDEREVERGGAARERDGVRDADGRGELALEGVDVRAERRDPVRLDRLGDELGLAAREVGGER